MDKSKQRINIFLLILFIIIGLICIGFEILKNNAYLIEKVFPGKLMLGFKSIIFASFGLFNFSVAEVLIIISVMLLIFLIVYFIKDIAKHSKKIVFVLDFIFKVIIMLGIFYIFFMIFCGIDYYRSPIEQKLNLQVKDTTKQELIQTGDIIMQKLNSAAQNVNRDEKGLFVPAMNKKQMFEFSNVVYKKLASDAVVENIRFSTPKEAVFSEALNYLNISGFYFPFTGEANINIKEGNIFLPFVICHEKAHQFSIMREQEANFVAFLACSESENNDFIYSGYLKAFVTILAQVYIEDKDVYKSMISKLDGNVKKDIIEYNKAMSKYEGPVSQISESVNNSYLKSQGQTDGVKSYGKMTDLLIAKYKS